MAHGPGGPVALRVVAGNAPPSSVTGTVAVTLDNLTSSAAGSGQPGFSATTLQNHTSNATGTVTGTVVAAFNGTTSVIDMGGADLTATAMTMGILVRPSVLTGANIYVAFQTVDGNTPRLEMTFSGNGDFIFASGGSNTFFGAGTFTTNTWYLIFVTKAAGTVTPRLHYTSNFTSWTHGNFPATVPNMNGTITRVVFGAEHLDAFTQKYFAGEIGLGGIWAEDTIDATIETYVDFAVLRAKANKQFFSDQSMINAGTVDDTSANNNDETGRTGITVGTSVVPAGFLHFPIINVTGTSATTLQNLVGDATGTSTSSGVTGTVAVTLEPFTSTATGTETITGTSATTLQNFTAAGVGGGVVSGTVAVTLANFTSTATGTETITGTVAQTLANFTSTATGSETITGTVARTLANFTSSATGTHTPPASNGLFPVSVSGNDRYLLDQNSDPYMIHGDTAWEMTTNVSLGDAAIYIEDRFAKDINAVILEVPMKDAVNTTGVDSYGHLPFTGTAFQSSLNEPYWQNVDAVIQLAAARGMTVFFWVAYLGFNHGGEGWWAEIGAASNAQVQAYGAALGARYKDYDNIVWVVTGDYMPTATEIDRYDHIMIGVQGAGDSHLATAHNQRRHDGAESFDSFSWFTLNSTYTVDPDTIANTVTAYNRATVRPTFLIEARYENFNPPGPTLAQLRREQWQQLLAGGIGGHFFGNENIWSFNTDNSSATDDTDWEAYLDDPGIGHSQLIKQLMDNQLDGLWQGVHPDLTDTFLTSGESSGTTQAAASFSTHIGIVYVATTGSITVDLTELSGPHATALVRWFDPTSGDFTSVGVFSTGAPQTISHPGTNDDGDNDWVLVVTGTEDATGIVAVTLQDFTSSASGSETITGSAAVTLQNFTSTATGWATATGTSATTLQNFTGAAIGTESMSGTVAVTLQNFTGAAAGWTTVTGTVAVTLQPFTSTASGTETITGTGASTLQDFTSDASGLADITGTVAVTLANFTGAASGSVTNPGSNGASVLQDFVGAATGSVIFTGTSATTLQNLTSAAAGSEGISGSAAVTLDPFTSTAAASETITGTVAVILQNFGCNAAGAETITGSVFVTLGHVTCSATGTSTSAGGFAAIVLEAFEGEAEGTITNPPGGLGEQLPFDDNVTVIIGGTAYASAVIATVRSVTWPDREEVTVTIVDRPAIRPTTFDNLTVMVP